MYGIVGMQVQGVLGTNIAKEDRMAFVMNAEQGRLRKPEETASDESHFARKAKWNSAEMSRKQRDRQEGYYYSFE